MQSRATHPPVKQRICAETVNEVHTVGVQVIFPKSANCEAVDNMINALKDLAAFHALAWTGGRSEAHPGAHPPPPARTPSAPHTASLPCHPPSPPAAQAGGPDTARMYSCT